MASVQFSHLDGRLAYLALQYHLARPGSELDPKTKQPVAHGLAEVAQALEPQLEQALATIELSEYQRHRLVSAIAGTVNELKTYPLLADGRHTTVPGFDAALRRLFPEMTEEPEEASRLASQLVALRRRLESAAAALAPTGEGPRSGQRRWWRFWEREGA